MVLTCDWSELLVLASDWLLTAHHTQHLPPLSAAGHTLHVLGARPVPNLLHDHQVTLIQGEYLAGQFTLLQLLFPAESIPAKYSACLAHEPPELLPPLASEGEHHEPGPDQ